MIRLPVLIVNFKTYDEVIGQKGVALARAIEKAGLELNCSVAVAVESEDLRLIASSVKIPVLAQHVDAEGYGAHTGSIVPESVMEAGGVGSLINHSEHQISDEQIEKTIKHCRKIGMTSVVCADTRQEAERLARFSPDIIAVEPPELIGGNVSVSSAKPEIISETVRNVDGPVLCGAGVKSYEDVKKAMELGSKGILIASGIVKSDNPFEKTKELLNGFKALES